MTLHPSEFTTNGFRSPMLPGARFVADVVLVAPQEMEISTAQKTYREKSNTTFVDLLSVNSFQTQYVKRINEALGLEALAAYLEADNQRVAILNCNVAPHTPKEVADKIRQCGAKIVGMSLIYRPQVNFALGVLEELKGHDVRVFVGGALASYMPRELLQCLPTLDGVVYGEAEETFRNITQAVLQGREWQRLPGLSCRRDGKIVRNSPGPPLDLTTIMAPTRKTLEYLACTGWPTRIASLYTSRGCMAKCTFCTGKDAYNVERTRTYRFRNPIDVVDEIETLVRRFGVNYVYINDDNFLGYGEASAQRIYAFARELLNRDLGIRFASECRVDNLDRELLQLLRQAGMEQALLGLETGSDPVLKRWRKGATVDDNSSAIGILKEVGIPLEPGFILFDAYTSDKELRENVDFLRRNKLDSTQFPHYLVNRLSVYPGTEIEHTMRAEGLIAPSPIPFGSDTLDRPDLIRKYFESLNYICRDSRAEISWRCLRAAIEPIEIFLEEQLPKLSAGLARFRGSKIEKSHVTLARHYIHTSAKWRRNIGTLIVDMIEACADSYSASSAIVQMRELRKRLTSMHDTYVSQTLGMDYLALIEAVAELNRQVSPNDISVVVATSGKWDRLRRTLTCLEHQNLPAPYAWEIIIVLDGVDAPDWLALYPIGNLRVVRNGERLGRGGARNRGVTEATGEYVILIDDDVVFGPGFVEAHLQGQINRSGLCRGPLREVPSLAYFENLDTWDLAPESNRKDINITRLRRISEGVLETISTDPELAWKSGVPNFLERHGADAYACGRMEGAWLAFAGANLSAPRRWLLDTKFDDRPGVRWGLEDLALSLKFLLAGRPLIELPGAAAMHLSHVRRDWRPSLYENVLCLDFLNDPDLSRNIVTFLSDEVGVETVEEGILPLLNFARTRQAG